MASVKTITLPDGSSYDFKATYDSEGNNISQTYINVNEKGAASGVAPLNSSGKIDESYLPTSEFVSESGSLVTFDYSKSGTPYSKLIVNIEPTQSGSGDPSPENVRTINGFDDVDIITSGKNMIASTTLGYTIDTNSGSVKFRGGTYDWISNLIITNGKPYTITLFDKGEMASGSINVAMYDLSGNFRSFSNFGYFSSTLPKNSTYSGEGTGSIILFGYQSGGASSINTAKMQIEIGSSATDYEPYTGSINTISFGDAGTVYAGTLDVLSGKLTVTHGSITATSVLYSGASGSSSYWGQVLTSGAKKVSNSVVGNVISSYLATTTQNNMMNTEVNAIAINSNGAITFKIIGMTSKSNYDSYLSSNPLTIVYELAEPIVYYLTKTEVTTLLGKNNVWSDTGDVEVEVIPNEIINYIKSNALVVSQDSSSGELTLS